MRVLVHDRLRSLPQHARSDARLRVVSARRLGHGINPLNESCLVHLEVVRLRPRLRSSRS